MPKPFRDRSQAGRLLAERLVEYASNPATIVLALPRGGVPVAREVARALKARLDLYIVRKIGAPGEPEFAIGAIGSGGARLVDQGTVRRLGINDRELEKAIALQSRELHRREQLYRGNHPFPDLAGRIVLLIDDGAATGATMRCAIRGVRALHPAAIVVALPVAPPETVDLLRHEADRVVVLTAPPFFFAVGEWYDDFRQVTDEEATLT